MNRNKKIIKTSAVGAAGNLFLSAFKLAIGIAANSVSIRADAINNTTDALSSIITIIGVRLSEKAPDRKHPFGYGRIEYLSSLLIGMLILYAGVGEILSSIRRISHPEPNDYSFWSLVIVAAAVLVKICMGRYTMRRRKALDSEALQGFGKGCDDGFHRFRGNTGRGAGVHGDRYRDRSLRRSFHFLSDYQNGHGNPA